MTIRHTALALVLALGIAPAALAQQEGPRHQGERFDEMQQTVDDAEMASDPTMMQAMMHEHMELMQDQMMSMRGMMDQHQPDDMEESNEEMHERMDMMQMMMEQMMNQQRMMLNMQGNMPGVE